MLFTASDKNFNNNNIILKHQEKCFSCTDITITALPESPVLPESTPTAITADTTSDLSIDCRVKEPNGAHRDDNSTDSGFASADEDESGVVAEKLLLEFPEEKQQQQQHHTCLYCADVRDQPALYYSSFLSLPTNIILQEETSNSWGRSTIRRCRLSYSECI